MPAPIPMPVRQVIFKRWRKGESVVVLAKELNLSVRTVQYLIRRFIARGQNGLETDYARCGTHKLPTDSNSFQKAIAMRQQHPGWGGGLIRVVLKEQGIDSCPSVRTLQRWFRRSLLAPAPPGRRPASDDRRAHAPHDVWQMDAVDQLPLASGQQVSWLRVVDECSGAVLQTTIFPPAFLEFGQARGRPRDVTLGFFAVGKASTVPRRQWNSLGIDRRLAYRTVFVADRPWRGHDLEPCPNAPRQWCGGTLSRDGQTLDRTRHVPGCCRIATTHGRHGSHSARGLS